MKKMYVLDVLKSLFNNTQGRTRSFHFDKLVNLSKWHFRETLFVRLKHSKTFKIITKSIRQCKKHAEITQPLGKYWIHFLSLCLRSKVFDVGSDILGNPLIQNALQNQPSSPMKGVPRYFAQLCDLAKKRPNQTFKVKNHLSISEFIFQQKIRVW